MGGKRYLVLLVVILSILIPVQGIDCDELFIDIKNCYDSYTNFYFSFDGEGIQETDNLRYTFASNLGEVEFSYSEIAKSNRFDSFNVEQIDENSFEIHGKTNLVISEIKITHNECSGAEYRSFSEDCQNIEECYRDDECGDESICQKGFCRLLVCDSCRKPEGHECVPLCNDDNFCTQDSCSEGVCTYAHIKHCCRSNDDCDDYHKCTIDFCDSESDRCVYSDLVCPNGECREPQGCVDDSVLSEEESVIIATIGKIFRKNVIIGKVALYGSIMVILALLLLNESESRKRRKKKDNNSAEKG